MNRYSIITAIAIIVIIIPIVYSGMNAYSAQQLKYSWDEPNRFSFFEMSNNGNIKLCNSSPYPSDFARFNIEVYYQNESKGMYTIENIKLGGNEQKIEQGKYSATDFVQTQHLFMTMDFQFDGGDMRVDPAKLFVVVTIDTPIIGVIPYSTVTQYPGFEFDQLMNQNLEC